MFSFFKNRALKKLSVSELCLKFEEIKEIIKDSQILMCIENLCEGETCYFGGKKIYFWEKDTIFVECERDILEIKTIGDLLEILKEEC